MMTAGTTVRVAVIENESTPSASFFFDKENLSSKSNIYLVSEFEHKSHVKYMATKAYSPLGLDVFTNYGVERSQECPTNALEQLKHI